MKKFHVFCDSTDLTHLLKVCSALRTSHPSCLISIQVAVKIPVSRRYMELLNGEEVLILKSIDFQIALKTDLNDIGSIIILVYKERPFPDVSREQLVEEADYCKSVYDRLSRLADYEYNRAYDSVEHKLSIKKKKIAKTFLLKAQSDLINWDDWPFWFDYTDDIFASFCPSNMEDDLVF